MSEPDFAVMSRDELTAEVERLEKETADNDRLREILIGAGLEPSEKGEVR